MIPALLAVFCALPAAWAQAQEPTDYDRVDARGFWIADTTSDPTHAVRLAYPAAPPGWDAGLAFDVARYPLVEALPDGTESIVDVLAGAHAYGGWTWRGMRFEGAMPVTMYGHDLGGGFAASGDLRLGALLPAWQPKGYRPGFGLQVSGWLPTGTATRWSGSPGVAAGAVVAVAQEIGVVGWDLNAGFRVGRVDDARNLRAGSGPIGGFDFHYRVADPLAVGVGFAVQGATGFTSVPLEAGLQARYRLKNGSFAMLGYGRGVLAQAASDAFQGTVPGSGVGASSGRVFFGVGYGQHPADEPPAPLIVPVMLLHTSVTREVEREVPLARLDDDKIVVAEQVFFREAKADLLPDSEPVLAAVAEVIGAHPELTHLLVEGHTNSRGGTRYNRHLSEIRAGEVMEWLVAHGVEADRILAKGFGEDRPLLPDDHPDAMVVNRRVEFTVLRSDEADTQPTVPTREQLPAVVQSDR